MFGLLAVTFMVIGPNGKARRCVMESRLLVLKRVLDALDIPASVVNVADRILVQKAVYLAQRAGIQLGYHYGWYKRGPYSTRLTRDYFELQDAIALQGAEDDPRELTDTAARKMNQLRPLFNPPGEFAPEKKHLWLELLASVDYLKTMENRNPTTIEEIIDKQKPHLSRFIPLANTKLSNFKQLLSS
jgi:hypothetical protein